MKVILVFILALIVALVWYFGAMYYEGQELIRKQDEEDAQRRLRQ